MNFGKAFGVALLSLIGGLAAHAQAGVYVGYSALRLSGIDCLEQTSSSNPPPAVYCSNGTLGYVSGTNSYHTGHIDPAGLQVGAYYDFKTIGPVRFGGDFRFIDGHSSKSASTKIGGKNATGSRVVLVGLRGVVKTPIRWLAPYGEFALGRNSTDATEPESTTLVSGNPTPVTYDSFLQYEVFAGADVHIFPFLDLRPIEVGIGGMNRVGSGAGTSSTGVMSVGAGVVFHLPHP